MRGNHSILLLSLTMAGAVAGVAALIIYFLYQTAFEQQRHRLADSVESHAAFIAAVTRHDRHLYGDLQAATEATMGQLRGAQARFDGFGSTGEFAVGQRRDNGIEFLLPHRHLCAFHPDGKQHLHPLSDWRAEPMRRALEKRSGTLVGWDYRGERVLAAYVFIPELGIGIVAKMDVAEVRAPFMYAGLYAGGAGLVLVLLGVLLIRVIGGSLVRKVEQSELYYRTLVRNGSDMLSVIEADGTTRYVSDSVTRILGYAPAELVGIDALRFIHPDDEAPVRDALRTTAGMHGATLDLRFRFRHRDGAWRDMELTGMNMLGDRAVQGIVVSTRDVTEQQRWHERLREREELYRTLFDLSFDGIFVESTRGEILEASPAACRMFGYDEHEMPGLRIHDLVPEAFAQALPDVIDEDTDGRARPRVNRRKDGSLFPTEISTRLVTIAGESRLVAYVRDITDRRRAEEALAHTLTELKRSNEDLEQFAYVASHDLQEPLRMVASYTKLLARRYAGRLDEAADEFIAFAVDGAERMQMLIEELLAYSRIGTRSRDFERVSTEVILARALRNLEAAVEEAGAMVYSEGLPEVEGDVGQLTRVFQNLISNAIRYQSEAPPEVHVAAFREGPVWHFTVRDNGIGIDPKHAERIFVIFQRLHTKDEYPGTGMGLAITKKIVERHGGRIWVESERGKGATLHFTLPAGEPAHAAAGSKGDRIEGRQR